MGQKAIAKADIIKKKARQKGKKIILTATNKAYDVKNMEAKEKTAEVAKKALDKKKEAEQKKLRKAEEKAKAKEAKAKADMKAKRMAESAKIRKEIQASQNKANNMLKHAAGVLATSKAKIRAYSDEIAQFEKKDGRGYDGAPKDVSPEKIGKARNGIRQIKKDKVVAVANEKKAKKMALNITAYADKMAEKEKEKVTKEQLREELQMEKDKQKAAERMMALRQKERKLQVAALETVAASKAGIKEEKVAEAQAKEGAAIDKVNKEKDKLSVNKAKIKEMKKEKKAATGAAKKKLAKEINKAKVKSATLKA